MPLPYRRLALAFAGFVCISLSAAPPARPQSLFVTTTQEDTAANQLIITGGPFADGVRVFLALVELSVVSVTTTQIVASPGIVRARQPLADRLPAFRVTGGRNFAGHWGGGVLYWR